MNINMWALDNEEDILKAEILYVPLGNWRVRLNFYIQRERMY